MRGWLRPQAAFFSLFSVQGGRGAATGTGSPDAGRITYSYEALGDPGNHIVAWEKKSIHDANPRVIAAFIAALDEANALFAADPGGAAKIRLAEECTSADAALVRAIIIDPGLEVQHRPTQHHPTRWFPRPHRTDRLLAALDRQS